MGVPLLVALLGARAAGPAILTITIDLIVTTSLCIGLSRLDSADEHGAADAARRALKGMALNPMAWSIALGAVASALQLEPIRPVRQTLGLLADAASPVALFTIGAVLARSQYVAALEAHDPMPLRDYLPIVLVKLVVHPLLVLGVGSVAIALGAPLARFTLEVMVLVAALPSASNAVGAGRALRRRHRPHRAHHPADDRAGLSQFLGRGGSVALRISHPMCRRYARTLRGVMPTASTACFNRSGEVPIAFAHPCNSRSWLERMRSRSVLLVVGLWAVVMGSPLLTCRACTKPVSPSVGRRPRPGWAAILRNSRGQCPVRDRHVMAVLAQGRCASARRRWP